LGAKLSQGTAAAGDNVNKRLMGIFDGESGAAWMARLHVPAHFTGLWCASQTAQM